MKRCCVLYHDGCLGVSPLFGCRTGILVCVSRAIDIFVHGISAACSHTVKICRKIERRFNSVIQRGKGWDCELIFALACINLYSLYFLFARKAQYGIFSNQSATLVLISLFELCQTCYDLKQSLTKILTYYCLNKKTKFDCFIFPIKR